MAYERLLTINAQGISGLALMRQEIEAEEVSKFLDILKQRTEVEVQKKTELALKQIPQLIDKLLWDFPKEERRISQYSIPVLSRYK
ncbi:hypothetical protein [Microseira wollei]|uniref:Uncharacterized protein n=1 Tax=Microseira wollei NIES-4236 TaxID=2530354 RepID=A0AAV3XCG0_9CYAN|nr:hypothetical protein [Microseira wollei]GET37077.1 hypothetical protein MiSe_18300 [Microseira wollei NIES-4236]